MNIEDLLRDDEPAILEEAADAVAQLEHYRRDGADATRRRLEALYQHLSDAVCARDLDPLLAHSGRVAQERFAAGFDLAEVQAAFARLEGAIARRALDRLASGELTWGLGLVTTALAHASGELGRTFATLAPRSWAGVDLSGVFRCSTATVRGRSAEELVYPV